MLIVPVIKPVFEKTNGKLRIPAPIVKLTSVAIASHKSFFIKNTSFDILLYWWLIKIATLPLTICHARRKYINKHIFILYHENPNDFQDAGNLKDSPTQKKKARKTAKSSFSVLKNMKSYYAV
jgi:hypothetical protein